jgi:predicted metal-dependent phosphoesterase TrpH
MKQTKPKETKYVDLHMHTRYSDGALRPEEIVSESASNGIEVMAITDHDITAGYNEGKREADA